MYFYIHSATKTLRLPCQQQKYLRPTAFAVGLTPYAKTYCTKVLLFFQRAKFLFSEKMRDFLIKQGRMHFLRGEVDSSRP